MAVVPVVPTVTGGVYTSSQVSQLAQVETFLLARPAAELRQGTTQSIPLGTWTSLTFDTKDLDSAGGWASSPNPSRYTAVYAGWYRCSGGYTPVLNTTGSRGTRWAVNGSLVNGSNTFITVTGASTSAGFPARTKLIFLNVGDYVELQVYQDTAGALGTAVATEAMSSMSIIWERNA